MMESVLPEEALIQCACGALRIFCARILLQFLEINIIIPAKLRRILAQHLSQIEIGIAHV